MILENEKSRFFYEERKKKMRGMKYLEREGRKKKKEKFRHLRSYSPDSLSLRACLFEFGSCV